jgi:hypothetical protein
MVVGHAYAPSVRAKEETRYKYGCELDLKIELAKADQERYGGICTQIKLFQMQRS